MYIYIYTFQFIVLREIEFIYISSRLIIHYKTIPAQTPEHRDAVKLDFTEIGRIRSTT